MTRFLPAWLTAHRAVLIALAGLAVCAFIVSATDDEFVYRPGQLALSLVIIVVVSAAVSFASAALIRVPPGSDSWLITALILFFILPGVADLGSAVTVAVGSAAAAVSKYILVWRRRLVVNPAVAGAVVVYAVAYAGIGDVGYPQWWVAAEPLLIPMIVIGIFLVTAIHEWPLVATFLAAALATIGVVELARGDQTLSVWLISSPMFFVAAVMLPEPMTSPTVRAHRFVYAVLVGVLMYWQLSVPVTDAYTLEFVPEIALLVGSLYTFAVRLVTQRGDGGRVRLPVRSVRPLAANTFHVDAEFSRPVHFRSGQWALLSSPRWSMPLWRSSRRVFSFATGPDDSDAGFAFTVAEEVSPYKRGLIEGRVGSVFVDAVGGDFVRPRRPADLVVIASGIGITPFRSMMHAADTDLSRLTVVHVLKAPERAVYTDDLAAVESAGARVITVVSATLAEAFDDRERLRTIIEPVVGTHPHYFVSGKPDFVRVTARSLHAVDSSTRWSPWRLHTDSFRGY